ncbi:cysteine-rich secretory protein 2 [Leptodactylus fuscus]|uniref:cysteine-rich secretory protein 2 n=1 Tax=Leptodactylus fuscus TaxID=238119 RepID=UPI003F4ED02F
MKLSLANCLMMTLIQGGILTSFAFPSNDKEKIAVISNSIELIENCENVSDPMIAYAPSKLEDFANGKHRKILRKRATGREVVIAYEDIQRMAQTPISALSGNLADVQKMILDCHNNYRREVKPCASNMLKLTWSVHAQKTAEEYAKKCLLGHSPSSQRRIPNLGCGENIFYCNEKVDWKTVVDSWYSECVDFTYGVEPVSDRETGHYTQVMWASSQKMGCGMAECTNGPSKYVYVCHYCPAGNKGPKKCPWKEGESCGACPNACEDRLCTNGCPVEDKYSNCNLFEGQCVTDSSMNSDKCPGTCQCKKGEIK